MIVVYTKVDGELAQWEVDCEEYLEAIQAVREILPQGFAKAILARIK